VRRPPRGVRNERYAPDDWFDVWFPDFAPSEELMAQGRRSRMAPTYQSAATAKTRPAATGLCFANY
jgi:uncharacterized protein YeaO (DUF488 family)